MGRRDGWVLGLDTATPWLSLALWHSGSGRSARAETHLGRAIAGRLAGDLAAFLEAHGVARTALVGIGVGVGPGSYTGIRIGIAAALGLGRALAVPVSGGSTLEALAYAVLGDGERAWVLEDARQGRAHALQVQRRGDTIERVGEAATLPRSALPADGLERYEGHAPDARWHAMTHARGAPPVADYG